MRVRNKIHSWVVLCAGITFLFFLGSEASMASRPERGRSKNKKSLDISKKLFHPTPVEFEEGIASWYGGRWIGRKTANGERYRKGDLTAAHRTLPFGTICKVTCLTNNRSVYVRINNRGPYIKGRKIDLSEDAARQLGMINRGIAKVRIEVLSPNPKAPKEDILEFVQNQPHSTTAQTTTAQTRR